MEWFQDLHDWIDRNKGLFWGLSIASGVIFLASLLAIPWFVARLPADHFRRGHQHRPRWFERHPALYVAALVFKNVLGAMLVLAGIAMLVLPGQGILSILVGASLLSLPGKRRLELWIVRRPSVMRALNWIRRRARKPPLEPPDGTE
jgi:Putative transmembrane protein (PGPGW)